MTLTRRAILIGGAVGLAAVASRSNAHDMAEMVETAPGAPVAADTVSIDNFSFRPAAVSIPVGGTVTWTNQDDIPHLVVANDHGFRSKPLDTGDSFAHTFAAAGTYPYFCGLHPKMTGLVKVG
jgi:plastocyanin